MTRIVDYKDLKVWQSAVELSLHCIKLTEKPSLKNQFWLVDQIRRSSLSIPSNIAEGFGRKSNGDFARFLRFSHGSANELYTQCLISQRLKYLELDEFRLVEKKISEIHKMLTSLILHLQSKQ